MTTHRATPPAPARPARRRDPRQLRRLLAWVRPYRGLLALGIVATVFSSLLGLIFPLLFGQLIDASFLADNMNTATLDRTVLLLLGIFALSASFGAAQAYLLARVGSAVVRDLRRDVFSHLLGLSPRFFAANKTGDLTSRLTSDVATVQGVASNVLAQAASLVIGLVGGVSLLVYTSPRLSLLTLAVIPLIVGVAVFLGRRIRKISREVQDAVAGANASAEEAISGVRVVQSFTAENTERGRYGEGVTAAFRAALRRARVQAAMSGSLSFLSFGSLALVLWYGGRLVMEGGMTPGGLVTFLFYAFQVGASVASSAGIFNQVQEALGASGRIFELLDERSELPDPERELPALGGAVEFQAVSFAYEGGGEVLRELSLRVSPGETVALVGPSGAGKSTLLALLARFYDVSGGRILLDGHDLREVSLASLRRQVAFVPQDTLLFSGSVAENIRYGRPDAGDAEVEAAARAANAHDFIAALPQGYATTVGERGVKLSGGQRQRVAIARALLKDAPLLLLDEATSALDSESESLVQAALERLMQGRTSFVVAHRLSTVRGADRTVVMQGGRIVAVGTHAELMRAGGLYRELYELQFRSATEVSDAAPAAPG